jgi:hypothetical protein
MPILPRHRIAFKTNYSGIFQEILLQESVILDIIIRIVHRVRRNGEMHEWIRRQVQLEVLLAFHLSV